MAGIIDSLMVTLGLDPSKFKAGVDNVRKDLSKLDNAVKQTGGQVTQLGNKWGGTLSGIVRSFAGPLLAGASLGAMIKSYTSDIAKVAKQQGVYNEKLEEERKKKALLQRITKEDLDLYKKSREAMSKFDIATSNLSATFMRTFAPAMRFAVEVLNKVSGWIDRNQGNITRFLLVVASIVSTALIPAFARWAKTMLANPITWLVVAIGALALIIDDLVTYIQGGDSAFADFWSQFGTGKEISEKLAKAWEWLKNIFAENREGLIRLGAVILAHVVAIKAVMAIAGPAGKAIALFGGAFKTLGLAIPILKALVVGIKAVTLAVVSNPIGAAIALVIAALVLLITNWDKVKEVALAVADSVRAKWEEFKNWFLGLGDNFGDIWNSLKTSFENVLNTIKGWFTGFIGDIKAKINSVLAIGGKIASGAKDLWNGVTGYFSGNGGGSSAAQTQAAIPPSAQVTTNNDTTVTNTANVGAITINTSATDANGLARDVGPAIQRNAPGWAVNAQNGVF